MNERSSLLSGGGGADSSSVGSSGSDGSGSSSQASRTAAFKAPWADARPTGPANPGGYLGLSKLLVTVYVVVMGVMIHDNGGLEPMNVNPMAGPSVATLNKFGANNAAEIKYNGEWWRNISPIILHAGVIHLLFNSYIQWTIGAYLEQVWGWRKWAFVYIVGGIFGNMLSSCMYVCRWC
jgi:membrane associated rhomboid family serine protease